MSDGPHGEPFDPFDPLELFGREQSGDAPQAWLVAALVTDPRRPELGDVAAVTLVPSVSVHTSDEQPGAEPVDVIAVGMLARGFGLVTALDPASLLALPLLTAWSARLDRGRRHLTIGEPDGVVLYDGDLGVEVPLGWYEALLGQDALILLVASELTAADSVRAAIEDARLAGSVVGARINLEQAG